MDEAQPPARGTSRGSEPHSPPGVPGWVKISLIVVAVLLVIVIIAMLVGGNHGPGRHQMSNSVIGGAQPVALDLRHAELGG